MIIKKKKKKKELIAISTSIILTYEFVKTYNEMLILFFSVMFIGLIVGYVFSSVESISIKDEYCPYAWKNAT